MRHRLWQIPFSVALLLSAASPAHTDEPSLEKPLAESWDYAGPMSKVAAKFRGQPGVVVHIGDSITYSNPYGQWARSGKGQTPADRAILTWMHAGKDDDTDGWWLARFDHPDGGRSYTAAGGLRADELLAGGKQGLPPLSKILDTYRPQILVTMLGTNDVSAGRSLDAYRADIQKSLELIEGRGIIPILSTIPPHPKQIERSRAFNEALREIAKGLGLPLIDYEREILRRRPEDWNGTLVSKDDVHPSAEHAGVNAASAPTADNLRNSGYLLRGWLSVEKIAEVKQKVIDRLRAADDGAGHSDRVFARREPVVVPPPKGTPIRVPVTRDTWFCNAGEQANGNNGGSDRLKLKSYQEMSLVDFDPSPFKGRVVMGAYLHLHLASPADPLRRVTVGSIAAPWVEGTATGYAPQKGSSSFNSRHHPNISWTTDDNRIAEGEPNDITAVTLGSGGTLWRMADATTPDADGWQQVPIDPAVVAARVAGLSDGFLLFDDTGSEWTRDGERYTAHPFPNRYVHSRESGAKTAPYFTVYLGDEDHDLPAAPARLAVDAERTAKLPPGEAWLTWETPADRGPAATLGFFVTVAGRDVPRYLIPLAGRVGQPVEMHLRDLWFEPGRDVEVAVSAVDGAGNVGNAAKQAIKLSGFVPQRLPLEFPAPPWKATVPETPESRRKLPRFDGSEIAIVDELDKARAASGTLSPLRARTYLLRNHLWDGHSIRLYAARNEVVGFQILFRGPITDLVPELKFAEGASSPRVSFSEARFVRSEGTLVADPVVPVNGKFSVPSPGAKPQDEKSGSLLCEAYVPHDTAIGDLTSTLELRTPRETLSIPLTLHVWNFTLPDHLSFIPEMNCYGVPGDEQRFYRLAHDHRTVLNIVPYHQHGDVEEGWAPKWDGHRLDWTAWDRRFGPLFDGAVFADSPRHTPQECFYLPLNENWPTPIEGNYNGDYWADQAFPPAYRQTFAEVSRQMAEHFNARGWNDTLFQCFFNGKNNYKSAGWSCGSSPWCLDEPASFQDFWALRYFGAAFHEGINRAPGKAKLLFRCDISRPEWQRDSLDGRLDYNVVSCGSLRQYERLVMDRKEREQQIVIEYGNSNAVEESNVQPAAWSIDAWSRGVDGVLPWLAVGSEAAWNKAEQTSLIYPPRPGHPEPAPSLRLKAFRRGQQDVEYLTLWSQLTGQPRWAVGPQVREALHLSPRKSGTGFTADEDAGILRYDHLKPEDLFALRVRLGVALDKLHPPPRRQLVDLRTPPRDPDRLPSRLVGE